MILKRKVKQLLYIILELNLSHCKAHNIIIKENELNALFGENILDLSIIIIINLLF